jgi:glutaredoxin 2
MIFGLKGVEHELVFVANHDEHTPIGLVGSKQTPILQLADGKAFPESLDILFGCTAQCAQSLVS